MLYTNRGIHPALFQAVMNRIGMIGLLMVGVAASATAQQSAAAKEEIPAQYRPPKGMCRIWLDDVPASRQPAPTDCASAVRNKPAKGRVIFGDDYVTKKKPETSTKRPSDSSTKSRGPAIKGFAPTKGSTKIPPGLGKRP